MAQNVLKDVEIDERKLIIKGIQKTLTVDNFKTDNIDWEIVKKFSFVVDIDKVIQSDDYCFEVVLKSIGINTEQFQKIQQVSKKVYGNNCLFYFNSENEWQCSFGVKKID